MAPLVRCSHCAKNFAVSRWDQLNGFLVPCPSCGIFNGRSWNIRAVALAGLFLHVFSFFLVMRPARALVSALAFGSLAYLTSSVATSGAYPALEVTWYVLFLLSPIVIDAALLVRHQIKLGQPSSQTPVAQTTVVAAPTHIRPK
ncbi:MAG: hypothetical protein U0529_14275 [Thermoanaerobaculia bacterium]